MATKKIALRQPSTQQKFKQQCSQRDAGLLFCCMDVLQIEAGARRAAALSRARGHLHVMSEEAGSRARSDRRIRGHALGRVVAVLPELRNVDNDWSIAEVSSSAALQLRERF